MGIAAISLVLALLSPITYTATDCPDVHVVGARGSGQVEFGSQVAGVIDAVGQAAASTGRTISIESLDYPAISVTDSFGLVLLNGAYDRSVAQGVAALGDVLDRLSESCANTDIVLVGYSQGAQVIKRALEGAAPNHRITGVILLADPTRDPSQRGITRLGDPSVERDGTFGAIALPDFARAVAIDVCAPGDGICERGRRDLLAHTEGYGDAGALVIPYLLAEWSERVTRSLPVR